MNEPTLGDFCATIDKFVAETDERLERFIRDLGFALAVEVIVGEFISPGTPIDTGFARESWYVVIGSVIAGPVPGTLQGGQFAMDQATLRLLEVKTGDVVYILNNADYIMALEFGHSGQAPQGMVRITLAGAQTIVDRLVRKSKAA